MSPPWMFALEAIGAEFHVQFFFKNEIDTDTLTPWEQSKPANQVKFVQIKNKFLSRPAAKQKINVFTKTLYETSTKRCADHFSAQLMLGPPWPNRNGCPQTRDLAVGRGPSGSAQATFCIKKLRFHLLTSSNYKFLFKLNVCKLNIHLLTFGLNV